MKIIQAIKSGFLRAAGSWKGILITWLISLILAAMIAVPLKAILKTGFGSSMITERFAQGINIETFTDMGRLFKGITASLGIGFLFLFMISFIVNAFLTGGLFESVNSSVNDKKFWQACARNFWSFILIQIIICIMIFFIYTLITGVPVMFISFKDIDSEKTIFLVVLVSAIAFYLILPVFIIVADYARAWKAVNTESGFLKALAYGFGQTFRTFGTSWFIMFLLIIVQTVFIILCLLILPGMIPVTGRGVFMFFIFSQVMFIARIFLRVLRYGSVTTLMEVNKAEDISVAGIEEPDMSKTI